MEDIEAEEYVRTKNGKIGIFDRYSSRKENSLHKSPFNCFIKMQNRKTPLQCSRKYIVKHSKHLIDVIEVGDIVNGREVKHIAMFEGFPDYPELIFVDETRLVPGDSCENSEIETILAHEQYEQNCFMRGEKR